MPIKCIIFFHFTLPYHFQKTNINLGIYIHITMVFVFRVKPSQDGHFTIFVVALSAAEIKAVLDIDWSCTCVSYSKNNIQCYTLIRQQF